VFNQKANFSSAPIHGIGLPSRCSPGLWITAILVAAAIAGFVIASATVPVSPQPSEIAANEASVITLLRVLSGAEEAFHFGSGRYGSLEELCSAGLLNTSLSAGIKQGYRFRITHHDSESWSAVAWPLKPGISGLHSFHINQMAVVRFERCESEEAPLANNTSEPY